jgi:trehalose synthase
MWKARPVVASRVGGITDQIEDGKSGLLVQPRDLKAFGAAVRRLLRDRSEAENMGRAARARVRHDFLAPRLLMQHARLLSSLVEGRQA